MREFAPETSTERRSEAQIESRRMKAIVKLWEAYGLIDDCLLQDRVVLILLLLAIMPCEATRRFAGRLPGAARR